MAYITISKFRQDSTFSTAEISDTIITDFINRGARTLRDECYILRRREYIGKTTVDGEDRYYFSHQYLADDNLDGTVNKDDIKVEEINSDGTIENDITAQVASIDLIDGYFTLNSGYPTSGANIYVTYRWTRYPITDSQVTSELEELNYCYAMEYAIRYQMTRAFKRGVSSQSTSGFSINRDYNTFKDLMKDQIERKMELLGKYKPRRVVLWKGNSGATQFPNSIRQPAKRDNLDNPDDVNRFNYYNQRIR